MSQYLMQSSLLHQTGCLHAQCFTSSTTQYARLRLRSPSRLSSRNLQDGASKAAGLRLAHGTCHAIPDQHAVDFLSSISSGDLSALLDQQSAAIHHSATAVQVLGDVADIDANTAKLLATVLQPFLSISTLLMVIRIVLSWYPQIPGNKMPWAVAYKPTEPILGPTRNIIKPVGGVDISPIIWVALLSFINEILLGPQGILNLLQRKIDLP